MQMPVFLSFTERARGAMPALYVPAERQAESVAFSTKVNGGRRRKSWRGEREGRREKKKKEQGRIGTTCARAHSYATTNGGELGRNESGQRLCRCRPSCRGKMRTGPHSPGVVVSRGVEAGRSGEPPLLPRPPRHRPAGQPALAVHVGSLRPFVRPRPSVALSHPRSM